jgi:hypothetical protein
MKEYKEVNEVDYDDVNDEEGAWKSGEVEEQNNLILNM